MLDALSAIERAIARRMGKVVRYEVVRLEGMTSTLVADVAATYPAVPVWHPDGRHIIVTQTKAIGDELWLYDVDGAGSPRRLTGLKGKSYVSPHCFTPDGRFLSVTAYTGNNADVLVLDLSGQAGTESSARTFVGTPTFEANGCFSPDGRMMAYESEESGRAEIYVRRFPGGEAVTRISRDGGSRPRWSPRGDDIYFVWTSLMASGMKKGVTQRFAAPRVLYRSEGYTGLFQGTSFDVSPTGRVLLRELPEDPYTAREIIVVQNWFRDVARLTGTR